jgi:hypothetical protein
MLDVTVLVGWWDRYMVGRATMGAHQATQAIPYPGIYCPAAGIEFSDTRGRVG